jgi:hypothetical protein
LRKTVKYVCSDMYEGFVNAAYSVFGKDIKVGLSGNSRG